MSNKVHSLHRDKYWYRILLVECPALWVSGSEAAAIVRCSSGMIGLVYALFIYMDRRSVATFALAVVRTRLASWKSPQVTGCDRAGSTFARSVGALGDQSLHRRIHIYIYREGGSIRTTRLGSLPLAPISSLKVPLDACALSFVKLCRLECMLLMKVCCQFYHI